MTTPVLSTLVRNLHRAAGPDGDGTPTDGELLERWAAQRDQAAFELLLWRHGPMILASCRRLLADPCEAEDAFQATWLVLVRKAGSVRRPEALAAWLHRVAVRVALRARADAAGRRSHERAGLPDPPAPVSPDEAAGRELRAALDDEIDRLPGHYRRAFVLCCLEGKGYAEAARQLGRPVGTVASWAARARQRLRARLERRGVTSAVAAVGPGLTGDATAGLPAPLAASTVRAATPFAASQPVLAGTVSARGTALAEAVLRAMFLIKVKILTVVLLVAAVATIVGLAGPALGLGEGNLLGPSGKLELWERRSLETAPPTKAEEPKQVGWLADASRAKIPDRPAAGRLHGKPFTVERATIKPTWSTSGNVGDPPEKQNRNDGAVITLQQGKDHVPRDHYTIFLAAKFGDTVDGKTFVVPPGGVFKQTEKIMDPDGKSWSAPVQGIQATSYDASGKRRTDLFPKASMRLELGHHKNGRLPGKIYLCFDDKEKTFLAGAFEAEVEKKPELEESKKLFGTWQATGGETGRGKLSAKDVRDTRVAFEYVDLKLYQGGSTTEAMYFLRPDKSPKQIDVTLTGKKNHDEKLLGIYRLEDDTLTLCLGEIGQPRPGSFQAEGKPGVRLLLRCRRAKSSDGR